MNVVVMSANIGGFDAKAKPHVKQTLPPGYTLTFEHFTDPDAPELWANLSNRLKARFFKMCGHSLAPEADLVIWLDASYRICKPDFVTYMIKSLGRGEICLMPHNIRRTTKQERDFILDCIKCGGDRLAKICAGDRIVEQAARYAADKTFKDTALAASGCFIYRNDEKMRIALTDWFLECVNWSCRDQLSLAYILHKHGIKPLWMKYKSFDCPLLEYTPHP